MREKKISEEKDEKKEKMRKRKRQRVSWPEKRTKRLFHV